MAEMKEKKGVFRSNARVTALLLVLAIAAVFALKSGDVLTGRVFEAGTENQPPQWTGSTNVFTAVQDAPVVLSLNELFSDPEGKSLTFIASETENISVDLQDNTLTITPEPGFSGERMISIVASDGETVTTERVRISVSGTAPAQSAPAAVLEQPTVQFHTQQADIIVNPADYSISNITPPKTTVQFKDATVMDTIEQCANISYNFASIDTVSCPQYNKAARITFEGLPIANFRILRNGEPCPSDICQNITFDDGNISFDVTEFSNYSINSSFGTNSGGCPLTLTVDTVLDSDGSSTTTCFTFNGNNIALDCDGHTATFNTGGGDFGYGVYASNKKNLIIKNCNFKSGSTGGNWVYGVYFNGVNYSTVYNNNITNAGTQNSKEHSGILIANAQQIVNVTSNWVNISGNNSIGISFTGALAGANMRVVNNTILTRATGTGTQNNGIWIGNTDNCLVTGNNIILNDSADSQGLYFGGLIEYGTVENNSIIVQGKSSNNIGISIDMLVKNINFTGNSINVNGTTNTHGIDLYYTTGHQFRLTNITTAGTSAHYGIYSFESNATFNKTKIANSEKWMYMYFFNVQARALYDNTTFATPYGSINILKNFTMDYSFEELNNSDVNVTLNRSFMRSTRAGIRLLNQSGIVTLTGLGTNVGSLRVDYQDDGTYDNCPSSVCNLLSSSGGTVVFNVSHFTTFGANTSGGAVTCNSCADCTTCTATQGNTCTLANDISSTTTCITVGNDNVTINCDGKTITFNTGAGGSDYGITASSRKNLTIENCTIISATSGVGAIPIYLLSTNSSRVFNNILKTNGASAIYLSTAAFYNIISANKVNATDPNGNAGIRLAQASQYNNISANTVITNGTIPGNYGILSEFDCPNNTISDNFIVSGGSQSSNYGIYAQAADHKIINNSINTTGTVQNNGMVLNGCSNSIIANNSIKATGTGNGNYGILVLNAVQTTFANNNIRVLSNTNSHGIYMSAGANRNIFILNNIATNGTIGYAIYIESGISGSNFSSTIINDTPEWIYTGAGASNNFSNTTFAMPDGSINILPLMQINGTQDITKAKLNISQYKAYLNSSNLSFLNTSAIITLYGITGTNPEPVVDYEDDNTYVLCPAGQCTELSYTPGVVYVFNTTHFTQYTTNDAGGEITSCPVTINSTYTLTQNLVSNDTCITIGNDSMVLDCAGYGIRYNANGTDNEYGILAQNRNNVTIRNCNVIDINATGTYGIGINFSNTTYSSITNSNISTNGTSYVHGISMQNNASYNNISDCKIIPLGAGATSHGIVFYYNATDNNVLRNNISAITGTGIDIALDSSRNSIANNTINSTVYSINIDLGSNNSTITNNTLSGGTQNINLNQHSGTAIFSNSLTCSGIGRCILLNTYVNNSIITYNRITAYGISGSMYGIDDISSSNYNNAILWNNVTVNASSPYGIRGAGTNTTIANNRMVLTGGTTGTGIIVGGAARLSSITNNSVLIANVTNAYGATVDGNNIAMSYNDLRAFGTGPNNIGIFVGNNLAVNNTFVGNNITVNGTNSNYGIQMYDNAHNSTYSNNIIRVNGTTFNNYGIYISPIYDTSRIPSNNYLSGNTIYTDGATNSTGIIIVQGINNTFEYTNISTNGAGSFGIYFNNSRGNSFIATQLNNTAQWINSTGVSYNNFTNTTFQMPDGSINFPSIFQLNGSQDITKTKLQITYNWARLNSTNLTALNTTGIITLYELPYSNPRPMVDYDDDSGYENCPADQCVELGSYSLGQPYVFNTTHFTTYSSLESGTEITSCPVTINSTYTLTQNLASNDTCITIGNDSMVLDCAGFNISYNFNGSRYSYGIAAVNRTNVTIQNCNIGDKNLSNYQSHGIAFFNTTNSTVTANKIRMNSTDPSAVYLKNSTGNRILLNNITTNSSYSATAKGAYFTTNSSYNIFANNILDCQGDGIYVDLDSSRNNITNNTITATDTSSAGNAVYVATGGTYNIISYNNMTSKRQAVYLRTIGGVNSTGNAIIGNNITILYGILSPSAIQMDSISWSVIENNTIYTAEHPGISMTGILTYSNRIVSNNITIESFQGGFSIQGQNCTVAQNTLAVLREMHGTYPISIQQASNYTNISYNTLIINGTGNIFGIQFSSDSQSHNTTIEGNNITITTPDQYYANNNGISISASGSGTRITNNRINISGNKTNTGIYIIGNQGFYGLLENLTVQNNALLITGNNSKGISLWDINGNILSYNTITLEGAINNTGLWIRNISNTIVEFTNITVTGSNSTGIFMNVSNGTTFNEILINETTTWINTPNTKNNISNMTYSTINGSIKIVPRMEFNGTSMQKSQINVTGNRAFLNSTALQFLNTSGIITLYGISLIDPKAQVDYADSGAYADCPAGQCTDLSYTGTTYVFNTTHFTSYRAAEGGIVITGCPVTINESTTLTQNLVSNTSCIKINNSNTVLDCNGYNITFNQKGGADFGINASNVTNIVIRNCTIIEANITGGSTGIYLQDVSNSTIAYNNVTVNGSFSSVSNGIQMSSSTGLFTSNNNTVANNTIQISDLTGSYGILINYQNENHKILGNRINVVNGTPISIVWYANNLLIAGNQVRLAAGGASIGIGLANTNHSLFENNTVEFGSSGAGYRGITIDTGSNYNTVSANNFSSTMEKSGPGAIVIQANHNYAVNNIINISGRDCEGIAVSSSNNTITGNNIRVNCNLTAKGVYLSNAQNNTVAYNNISGTGPDTGITSIQAQGIYTFAANYNNITQNNITVNGTGSSFGFYVKSSSRNNLVTENIIAASGTGGGNLGIHIDSSDNNTFDLNAILTSGTESYGILLASSKNNTFSRTLLNNTVQWINLTSDTQNNTFVNTTFAMPNGSINILRAIINGSNSVTKAKLNISSNKAFLNSSNLTFLNTSAIITLYGISYINPKARVDYADNGGYIDCPASQCTELGYTPGQPYVFNTTHFTSYQAAEGEIVITGCPVTINESTTLTQNISSNDTCITINASNMLLDCNGSTIFYNANGSDNEYGIFAENRINVTVKNCVIVDINETGTAGYGINFTSTNNSIVTNTSIITNSTVRSVGIIMGYSSNSTISNSTIDAADTNNNWAIGLFFSPNTTITGNTLLSSGGAGNNHGISMTFYCDGSRISYNNISSNGTSNNWGIYMQYINYATISNNTITSNGTDANMGMFVQYSNWNNISSNSLSAHGSGTGNRGIYLMYSSNSIVHGNRAFSDGGQYGNGIAAYIAENNTITFNEISTNGAGFSHGVLLNSTNGFSLLANNISTNGVSSYGIFITMSNATMLNKTVLNDTVQWIFLDSDTQNNFTNTTFQMPYGSINILPLMQLNGTLDVTKSKLYTSTLLAFMNSTNLSMLNTTGIITLYGVTFIDPKPIVDYEDDSSYVDCPADQCAELGYSGGVFTFNTTHFTGFMVEENATAITGCPVIINSTGALGSNVTSNDTCITINNSNTVFDCNGHTIYYNANGSDGAFGIAANSVNNITIRNCVIRDINLSGAFGIAVNLTNVSNSTVQNNNITTNGTNDNYGIQFMNGLNYNTISNNVVSTFGSSASNIGLSLYGTGLGNNATGNNITTNGTAANYGIMATVGANNTIIASNTIATSGSSSSNDAITLFHAGGNNVTDNNITAYGNSNNNGVKLNFNANDNIISNNRISSAGSDRINYGVYIRENSVRNNITGNIITTNGTDSNSGIYLEISANNNIIDRNIVSPGGNADFNIGIYLRQLSSGNSITRNNVTTNGGSNNNYGITLTNGTSNTISSNIVSTNGTGDLNYGIYFYDQASGNSITNNNITTNGGSNSNDGIGFSSNTNDNIISGNKITAGGRASYNNGISLLSFTVRNNITNNEISTSGTEHNTGIILEDSAQNNILNNNTITTSGNYSYAIEIMNSNYSTFNITTLNNPAQWINASANTFNNITNTTFAMPEGSINIPGIVQLNGGIEVTKAKLNITANRAFLNTAAVPLLNTIGIITLNNIFYTSPQPRVDFTDAGGLVPCPSSICTNLSYSGNVFVFNVTHFTTYAAGNDTVIINSTIIDSNISNCTVINSTVINSTKSNCTIINSYIINSTNNNTVIIDTNETNSLDNDTFVDDGIIIDATKAGSNINNSNITNSTITNCTVINSTVINSNKIDCVIINSNIIRSNNTNTTIIGSNETNSTDNNAMVYNSTIIGSIKTNTNVTNSTLIDSNKTNSTIINSYIIRSNNTNSVIIDTNETNSTDINATVDDSIIIDARKINTVINGTNVTNSNITNSTLTNCTVINSTIDRIIDSNCVYINYHGPTPGPGGGGGGGGGGIGGVIRNLTKPSAGGQNLCVESWVCEEWSRCENEMQLRECVDQYHCNTTTLRPAIERKCTMPVVVQEQPTGETRPHSKLPPPQPLEFPEEKTLWSGISSITHSTISLFQSYMWPIIFVVLGILLLTGAYIGITRARKHEAGEMPPAEPEEAITITRVTAKQPGADADTGALLDSLKSSGDALAEFEKEMRKLKK